MPDGASGVPPVIAVFGPTASGKTRFAVELARSLGTVVVNLDPAQAYRGLPILTNQPTPAEDAIAAHELVGCWGLDEVATVARHAQLARAAIDAAVRDVGHVVACGGSGLYHAAALRHLAFPARRAGLLDEAGSEVDEEYGLRGGPALHAELAGRDPAVAARIHPNDRKRLVRALEVARAGDSTRPTSGGIWNVPYRHPTLVVNLVVERGALVERITRRTHQMFRSGVVEEVATATGRHDGSLDRLSLTARRIHGVSDVAGILAGQWDEPTAIEQLATRTRQYARRQRTWARRWKGRVDIDVTAGVTGRADVASLAGAWQRASAPHETVRGGT